MRNFLALLALFSLCPLVRAETLDIYFIDVEGGAATLIVTPAGESILVDTGWKKEDARDARRIHKVAAGEAGLSRIDYLVTTHFHRDHFGGAAQLAELMPIKNFLDNGPRETLAEDPQFSALYSDYMRANRGERRTLNPGDYIALSKKGNTPLEVVCVASGRRTLRALTPMNPLCAGLESRPEDPSDNAASVGLLLRFGAFEFLDNGDLTWNIESALVCPNNVLGKVDLYQVTHHGMNTSNNPVLVRSLSPTVAIVNNGPLKGGHPDVYRLLKGLDGVEEIFQVHRNLKAEALENTSEDLIANLQDEASCMGHWLRVRVEPGGSGFSVYNSRNGLTRSYRSR